jgi:hypothetical protein
MKHAESLAMIWGSTPPIFSIGYDPPDSPHDSGFTVLFDDAPDPSEVMDYNDPRIRWFCLHCLLDEYPEIGRGLDIAREHLVADLDDAGEWQIGDKSRLEPDDH